MGEAKGNATKAARMAGYGGSDTTLASVGAENLKKPQILEAVKERIEADPIVANREECQRFWSGTMRDEKLELRDRIRASELLAKSHGVFVERHDVSLGLGAQAVEQLLATLPEAVAVLKGER